MMKDAFDNLSHIEKLAHVRDALCYVLENEDFFPLNVLDTRKEVSIIKIILKKYLREECEIS